MNATLSTAARRTIGVTTLALLLAGPPYALLRYLDSPLPDQPPTWHTLTTTLTSPLTDEMIGTILTALLWAAWASFAWSVLAELATALTGLRLPQPRALTPTRGLAALLVAMITGGVLATAAQAATPPPAARAHPSASGAAAVTAAQHEALTVTADTRTEVAPAARVHPQAEGTVTLVADGREYTHTVKRGDTLSKIAEQWLGDPHRWPEIFALNRGTHYPTVGGTLRNPNLIYPGWTLDLPADATPPAGHQPRPAAPTPPAPTPAAPPQPDTSTPTLDVPPAGDATASTTPQATAPSTSTTSPTPASSTAPTSGPAAREDGSRPQRPDRGVSLPSGSWVDGGLAIAIAAAVALVWAHRQRRYHPRKPSGRPHVTDPDLAPMPLVVRRIRRGLPSPVTGDQQQATGAPHDQQNSDGNPAPRTGDHHEPADDTSPRPRAAQTAAGDHAREVAEPVAPALTHPLAASWPPAGLGLAGPGADAAARGFLTAALAAGGTEHPDARTHVVIPAATAATLLGAATVDLPRTPRLTVTADLGDALEILEEHTMHRSRLVYQHEADTVADLRAADPHEEPLAPIMLLADANERHERARVAALLTQGQRLDIHGVLLGDWPDGDTATVAPDGTVTRADSDARHGPHPADVGRLTVLDPAETIDLLATLAEAHTGRLPAPAPTESPPPSPPTPAADTTPAVPQPSPAPTTAKDSTARTPEEPAAEPAPNADDPHTAHTPTGDTADSNTATEATEVAEAAADDSPAADTSPDEPSSANADDNPAEAATADTSQPTPTARHDRVEVTVLGPPAIVGATSERTLRAKSLELLVYLAVCDGDAAAESILDDLLPDAPASKATHRLHTYVSDLRAVLRRHAGPATYLSRPHHRYHLNPDRFDIDLWRLRAAIRHTGPQDERVQALRDAVANYRPLAEGCDYEWLEPHRHAVQRDALDAVTTLLEELTDQPDQQAAVCDTALPHHPYSEQLYQQAMRAHARLGNVDAIRALRRTLTRRLAEIDTEPDDATLALADRLIAEVRARRGPRPPRGGPSA